MRSPGLAIPRHTSPGLNRRFVSVDLQSMLVRDWMTRRLWTVGPEATIASAVGVMIRGKVRRLVVEVDGQAVGMLARSDVLRAAPAGTNPFSVADLDGRRLDLPVRQAMTAPVITVSPQSPIEEAASLMKNRKIGALIVMADHQLAGILTESDIFRAFVAMLGDSDSGVRICFDISAGEDAVAFTVGLASRHGMRLASVSTYRQEQQRIAVVRLAGPEPPGMLDELWTTGHRVLSVIRPRTG